MSDMEENDELNRILERNFGPPHAKAAHAESIEPSSGFAASVMERVREEAATTASPIRFPWVRAVPGICMALLAVAVCATVLIFAVGGVMQVATHAFLSAAAPHGQASSGVFGSLEQWRDAATRLHLGWLGVGLLIAFLPVTISRSILGRSHRV